MLRQDECKLRIQKLNTGLCTLHVVQTRKCTVPINYAKDLNPTTNRGLETVSLDMCVKEEQKTKWCIHTYKVTDRSERYK